MTVKLVRTKEGVFSANTKYNVLVDGKTVGYVTSHFEYGHNYTDGTPLFKTYRTPHIYWEAHKDFKTVGYHHDTRKKAVNALVEEVIK